MANQNFDVLAYANSSDAPLREERRGAMNALEAGPVGDRGIRWAQALILLALYILPTLWCFRTAGFADVDVWWHMRSGEWILQHHSIPQTDPFSIFGAGKPWNAYSWLFDILIFQLFQKLGLTGLVTYSIAMVFAFVVLLHRMIRHLQPDFTIGILLTFAAAFCIAGLDSPRSWWFSILFFIIEVDILMQVRKSGKTRSLAWLPLVFALWANLHIQFIDGLIVMFLALMESVVALRWRRIEGSIPAGRLAAVSALCMAAPLANPAGWGIYKTAYDTATQPGILYKISEMQSLSFRSLNDFGVLFFALLATAVLARARRTALFELLLLAFAVIVSFRSERDAWVVVITACAILAAELPSTGANRLRLKTPAIAAVGMAAALLVAFVFEALHVDNARMQSVLAEHMPVRAVEVVKARGYGGPLFNDFNWGGYLMWDLRMPVTIDGRAQVYGDDQLNQSLETWGGGPEWRSDPYLAKAGLVIGPAGSPLVQLLRMDSRFKLVFEDEVAAVFVAAPHAAPKTK